MGAALAFRAARSCCNVLADAGEPDHLRPQPAARAPAAGARARAGTFLIDRVAAELAERLAAVLRTVRARGRSRHAHRRVARALAEGGKVATVVAAAPDGAPGDATSRRRRRGGLAVRRRLARSGGLGAGAAIRQRFARRADPDPPRAQAGRPVAGGADRRRQPERIARSLCRRPKARSKAASRRAWRRSPMCANSARCCSAPASRCRWSTATG